MAERKELAKRILKVFSPISEASSKLAVSLEGRHSLFSYHGRRRRRMRMNGSVLILEEISKEN